LLRALDGVGLVLPCAAIVRAAKDIAVGVGHQMTIRFGRAVGQAESDLEPAGDSPCTAGVWFLGGIEEWDELYELAHFWHGPQRVQ